jgi:alpha-N-arabinofuranosidase
VKDAVFTALVLNALQRLSKIVPIATFAQTVNVLPLIVADDEGRVLLTPQYLVFKMYAEAYDGEVVEARAISDVYRSRELDINVPYIDVSAVYNRDRKELRLYIVNRSRDEEAEVELRIKGFAPSTLIHKWVSGEDVNDRNTFENPDNVKIQEGRGTLTQSRTVKLPPHSVNVIHLS